VPWVINNAIQVAESLEFSMFILVLYLVEFDHFNLNMTVRTKCSENEEDVAGQELIGMSKRMLRRMLTCGHR